MKKSLITTLNRLGFGMNNYNTHCVNVNSAKEVWWFTIPKEKFERNLFLICNQDTDLYLMFIEKNTLAPIANYFKLRANNESVEIEICSNKLSNNFLTDIKPGGTSFNFKNLIDFGQSYIRKINK